MSQHAKILSYQCLKTNTPSGYTSHECVQFFFRSRRGLLKPHGTNSLFKRFSGFYRVIFTESAPLGRFSHRDAMSVSRSVCLSICGFAPLGAFFLGLSLALRSHDQFQASHCTPICSPPLILTEKRKERTKMDRPPPNKK